MITGAVGVESVVGQGYPTLVTTDESNNRTSIC